MAYRGSYYAIVAMMDATAKTQYDTGVDGVLPRCRSCGFHRPYWAERTCVYRFCPYSATCTPTERIPTLGMTQNK